MLLSTSVARSLQKGLLVMQSLTSLLHAVLLTLSGAVNSNLHPMVSSFLSLGNERIVSRYCHLNPSVSMAALTKLLSTPPRYFRWSGADLFNVTNQKGKRQMIVVETNSCPSGQKSMPSRTQQQQHKHAAGFGAAQRSHSLLSVLLCLSDEQ